MADRPPFLCELDKNKLIDTQVGFVDTFNYAVRAIDNLEGGKNCTVDWTTPDHPIINVDIPESDSGGGGGGSGGGVDGVEDVTWDSTNEQLKVSYTDPTKNDSYIDIPIKFNGTDSSSGSNKEWTFSSESDSNVTVKIAGGYPTGLRIYLGVYYK